ncbi:hypothetical protein D3C81_1522810 [compost metagenome]
MHLLNHEASDDLLVAGELILRLLLHQLRLPYQKGDQPHAVVSELIMDVAQPFQRMLGQPLRFVAKEHHNVTRAHLQLLVKSTHQSEALVGNGPGLWIPDTGGAQQCTEERALVVAAMIFARHPQHEDVTAIPGKVQCQIINCMSLAHARTGVDQRARDQYADAVINEVDEAFNSCGRHTVVTASERVIVHRQA